MSTPMLEQYNSIKQEYQDTILLFRLGDFYEAFNNDAKTISKVLGITLTGRGKSENRIPMAGIPHHALKNYLAKLVKSGYKVAIADQLEEAKTSKLVKRGVVKVVTPGTIMDEEMIPEHSNNYIAAIFFDKKSKRTGLSYADLTTGEFKLQEFETNQMINSDILGELAKLNPKELLLPRDKSIDTSSLGNLNVQFLESSDFEYKKSLRVLLEAFEVVSLKPFGIEKYISGIVAAGALFQYFKDTQKRSLPHITSIKPVENSEFMNLDDTTIKSLELINPIFQEGVSVYTVLNHASTPMGQRLLGFWLLHPLLNKSKIEQRYDCIEEVAKQLKSIREKLDGIVDLERILARIATRNVNARDLVFLKESLKLSIEVLEIFEGKDHRAINAYLLSGERKRKILEVIDLIDRSIKDSPAITITEGEIIKPDYNEELAKIVSEAKEGRKYISDLEEQEKKKTGISSLKVRFNNVFGYYIEVSRSNSSKVPENYQRKQTLVNAERYITEELKYWEDKVLSAQEKASALEFKIFEEIRGKVVEQVNAIQSLARSIAHIDVFANFALLVQEMDLVRPTLTDELSEITQIVDGKHIVVMQSVPEFIPNDTTFSKDNSNFLLITGPNMSGKSTYIRQVALIILFAQIGCFVPAKEANLVITDRIFTRVGSADNLAKGESTFMVEMSETANILHNATERSLVILDEIGRGTSTYDGLSLAWSIVEYISKEIKARTLFATHYHELTLLEEKIPSVKNYNVEVREVEDEVIFMHKILPGATDRSYGIYVAKIAGLPHQVISRADDILEELESDKLPMITERSIDYSDQLSLMSSVSDDLLKAKIGEIRIDELTPIDALLKLRELQDNLNDFKKEK